MSHSRASAGLLTTAAVAALGAGLQVAIGTLVHGTDVSPAFAAFTVAIPVTVYLVVLAAISTRTGEPAALGLTFLTAALILAAALATPALTLPGSIVIMVVLVALLLAYHLAAAHRPRQLQRSMVEDQEVYPRQEQDVERVRRIAAEVRRDVNVGIRTVVP